MGEKLIKLGKIGVFCCVFVAYEFASMQLGEFVMAKTGEWVNEN